MTDLAEYFICVFCGGMESYRHFLIPDAPHNEFIKCRLCGEKYKKEILIAQFTPYQWGLWLALNIDVEKQRQENKFRQKIHYKLLYNNLEAMVTTQKKEFKKGYYYIRNAENINTKTMLSELNYKLGIWKLPEKKITLNSFSV